MRILMLVNWKICYLLRDRVDIQPPDKVVIGEKYWFFKYWPENNIHVDVMDFSKVPFLHYFEKRILKFYIFQSIRALFRGNKYDLIISHGAQSGLYMAFLQSLMEINLPPHIIIDVGCFNGGRDNGLETLPIKFASRSLSGLIYHASIQREYYRKYLPFLIGKTRFIPFGVDTDLFHPMQKEKDQSIVSIGYTKRDYKTLLEAWCRLNPNGVELKIIGINSLQDLDIKTLPFSVKTMGRIPINEVKERISKSRFVVIPLPYYKYAYGQMTLLQCMSMGKAVIVTKTPSTLDYIADGDNALFVVPYDVDDMRRKIEFLLANQSVVVTLGKQARETVEQRFNEKNMAQNIYRFVNEIIK